MPRKKTWEEVNMSFQDRKFILLSQPCEYKNKLSRLTCMDDDGYLYYLTYDLVADKRIVSFNPVAKSNKYSIKNIQHWIELQGSKTKILSSEYEDEKSLLEFECECGQKYNSFWNRMNNISKCRCNNCGEKIRTSCHTNIEDIKKEIASYGYNLLDNNIQNIKNIHIADKDGNEYNANLFALRYGYIYRKTSKIQSMLELKTAEYLDFLNIDYIVQYVIDGCKNIHSLRFDFYLPKYNFIIEVHGEQHYKESRNWFNISLKEQQERDAYKRNFCLEHGYKYVEIPYTAYGYGKIKNDKYKEIINKILE